MCSGKIENSRKLSLMTRHIYFSIQPKYAGFTDQLLQFSALYELGQSLGYTYWHEPFLSPRSSSADLLSCNQQRLLKLQLKWPGLSRIFNIKIPFNVYDFLGIDDYFWVKHDGCDLSNTTKAILIFNDRLAEENEIDDLVDLQAYIRQFAADHSGSQEAILLRFVLEGRWPVWQIIRQEMAGEASDLDLRGIYFQKRRRQSWPSLFAEGKVKTVVHMRLGDTAVLPTPWNTFIPLWSRGSAFQEYAQIKDIPTGHRLIQPEEYFHFFQGLTFNLGEALSALFFSDGYERAAQKLRSGFKQNKLDLSAAQYAALHQSLQSFDEIKFKPFEQIEDGRLFVGETPENLCHLIHSFLMADLVIIGSQLWMFPKLAALYFDRETMPLVIVLHKAEEEDAVWRYGGLNLGERKEQFIFVNINRPDYEEISSRLSRYLAQNRQFTGNHE